MTDAVEITPGVTVGDGGLVLFAGPCVIESRELVLEVAAGLERACTPLGLPWVFKASFDKANRTGVDSFRSIGMDAALAILDEVARTYDVPVLTDVHDATQVTRVAEVVDVLQIPAFLCRQTDLLLAAGATGRTVNVKKGQFMAPEDMAYAVAKVRAGGGERVLLTERGTTFGYHDLVVDLRGLATMRAAAPVVFDATHSVQTPGGAKGASGGRPEHIGPLARAAVAFGIDALFVETHPRPAEALSDAATMLPMSELDELLGQCLAVHRLHAGAAS